MKEKRYVIQINQLPHKCLYSIRVQHAPYTAAPAPLFDPNGTAMVYTDIETAKAIALRNGWQVEKAGTVWELID